MSNDDNGYHALSIINVVDDPVYADADGASRRARIVSQCVNPGVDLPLPVARQAIQYAALRVG